MKLFCAIFTLSVLGTASPLLACPQVSDESASQKADAYVTAEIHREKIPGLALAVMRDGKIIKAHGYGLSNVELDVPVKPETIFQTGSVGKQFTASAVMMLVEDGKISLDDKISKYFPESPAAWKDIIVRHLLTHTSGIPDYGSEENATTKKMIDLRVDYTEDQLVQRFATFPLDFPPGSQWKYSNSGYVILGVLIHRVSGKFYGDFLEERVFKPLHMDSTHIISEENIVQNRSAGYRLVNGELKNQEWVAPKLNTTADGALYTNVLDMAKWDAALTQQTLLKKSSYEQMYRPVRLTDGKTYPYGFGWSIGASNGHPLIEHSGSWQGFHMNFSRYPADKLSVVVFTNLDSQHSDPIKIAHEVAAIYLPELRQPAPATPAN
ncbi:MAG: beta-lactamase family protein [Acidobacteriota bacterium]|nr:beta-lactamase family protein [Acidobacteriota bacterium]